MTIKKISVDDVKIGMFIEKIEVSWWDHPFLANSIVINSEKDLKKLKNSKAKYVYIDSEKGFYNEAQDINREKIIKISVDKKGISEEEYELLKDEVPLEIEKKTSRKLYRKTKAVVEEIFKDIKNGKEIKWDKVYESMDKITESVLRNKDAFINLTTIKKYDEYTFYHSMNVCCLCITMGRYLLFSKDELMSIGIGALLHDTGKIKIPENIINKPGKLTDNEFNIIKKHPEYSREILSQYKDINQDSLDLAYQHHEKFNGKGYPQGLMGISINKFAMIASIADVYDAITSDRVYQKARPVDIAMKKILEWGREDFAHEYVLKFSQCMGIYPVSSVLELDNREVGIVAEVNHLNLERPKIIKVLDSEYKALRKPELIDLEEDRYRGIEIKRCLDARRMGINTNYFLNRMKVL